MTFGSHFQPKLFSDFSYKPCLVLSCVYSKMLNVEYNSTIKAPSVYSVNIISLVEIATALRGKQYE